MDAYGQIQLIAILVAVACSIIGPFLILRREAMLIDSITHTILLGIVLAFFVTPSLNSPFLIIGAALMGLITVFFTEWLTRTKLVNEDASIGIIFPLLFSIAIILISKYASRIHLDIDSVLLGKLEYAPFDSLIVNGQSYGAKSIYVMLAILLVNAIFVAVLYKELKITTFDAPLAFALGFSPAFIGYALMAVTSVTTVGAFQAVGSILAISFMVGPAATAYFLTEDLKRMIFMSIFIGAVSSFTGTYIAFMYDLSIAGMISSLIGAVFIVTLVFAPKKGLIAKRIYKKQQRKRFLLLSVLYHIYSHTKKGEGAVECDINEMNEHLRLEQKTYDEIIVELLLAVDIEAKNGTYMLTDSGEKRLRNSFDAAMLEMI